jgi:hypothetical protein
LVFDPQPLALVASVQVAKTLVAALVFVFPPVSLAQADTPLKTLNELIPKHLILSALLLLQHRIKTTHKLQQTTIAAI